MNTPLSSEISSSAEQFSLDFPRSLGPVTHTMGFRTVPEDFRVTESLGFAPEGEGEHLLLQIRKREANTRWVAHQLAQHYGIDENAVGYCGLKDRRAVTTQWFSVQLPISTDAPAPDIEGCEILQTCRHTRKLRPGMHSHNSFSIVLRGDSDCRAELDRRLETIALEGVPNYFGEQRFGINGNNLVEVAKIVARERPRFKGKRGGLYLSAARSWLFNQLLAHRVENGSWRSVPDGPLWGRGRPSVSEELAAEEKAVLAPWSNWCDVLEHSGLRQERRELVLKPVDFRWAWQDANLTLDFALPPGTYATALLRELANLEVPETRD